MSLPVRRKAGVLGRSVVGLPGRKRGSERGAAQVEFALVILFTVVLMFWVIEMMSLVYTYTVLSDAAKEGVRYAIVHGSGVASPSGPADYTAVQTVVKNYAKLSLHDISAITVTPSYPDGDNEAPHRVKVIVTYAYKPYITLPMTSPTINTVAEGRINY